MEGAVIVVAAPMVAVVIVFIMAAIPGIMAIAVIVVAVVAVLAARHLVVAVVAAISESEMAGLRMGRPDKAGGKATSERHILCTG